MPAAARSKLYSSVSTWLSVFASIATLAWVIFFCGVPSASFLCQLELNQQGLLSVVGHSIHFFHGQKVIPSTTPKDFSLEVMKPAAEPRLIFKWGRLVNFLSSMRHAVAKILKKKHSADLMKVKTHTHGSSFICTHTYPRM